MIPERLEDNQPDGRYGHEWRYRMASAFIQPCDVVLDAACGTGYGRALLPQGCHWVGIDKNPPPYVDSAWALICADLCTWEPNALFDVAISFETIEHLPEYDHFIGVLKQARKWILASVPVVETVGVNPWHCHDFCMGDLRKLIEDDDWEHYQTVVQFDEFSEVACFRRIVR